MRGVKAKDQPCAKCGSGVRVYGGSYCLECNRARHRDWKTTHPERMKELESSSRGRRVLLIRDRMREAYARDPQKVKDQVKTWGQKNRERMRIAGNAKSVVRRAVASGVLIRPNWCEQCGMENVQIEGAHEDYARPLDVRWLCKPCHRTWDRKQPKTIGGISRE